MKNKAKVGMKLHKQIALGAKPKDFKRSKLSAKNK